MSLDNQDKNINKDKTLSTSSLVNKSEFDSIKDYLNSQPNKINQLNDISKTLNSIINNFIEYTKNYSGQIEYLAMKIVPNYSIEGQLMQTIQTILLFYSESLNELVSKLRDNMVIKQEENASEIIEQFKFQKKIYSDKIKHVNSSYKVFKKEINLYQEYLVNNEYKEHVKTNNLNISDDDIISEKEIEEIKRKNDLKDIKDELQLDDEENIVECQLNDINNKSSLIKSNKEYVKHIKESNELLNKIRQFLSIEKTNFLKGIFNLCHYFGEGLLNFAERNKNDFENQTKVLNKLLNKLILEEKNATILTDYSIKLKYLEIYSAHISEKKRIKDNNQKDKDNNEDKNKNNVSNYKSKGSDKNNIKITRKNNKKKNTLSSKDTTNLQHKNDLMDRRTISFSNQQLNMNYLGRTTFNPNKLNNLLEEDKEEAFKSIVIKLTRDEIINIFNKIKDTKIILNESDVQLIETEKNYKIIKEILVILFIHPEKYQEENKNILIDLFEKDKKYIYYFIKVLNDHRTKGNFYISEFTLKYFGEIFKYLNNFILSKNDMEIFKYILILSQTYYYNNGKDKQKIFLFSYIKDYPGYSSPKFFEDYLKELIKHDLKNLDKPDFDLENINLDNNKKDEKEKLVNCFFSNFLTITKVMADFNLDNKFVREFVEKNKSKYYLSQSQIDNICLLYEMSVEEEKRNKKDFENNDKNINENEQEQIISNNKDIDNKNELNKNENEIKIEEENKDNDQVKLNKDINQENQAENLGEINIVEENLENNIINNEKKKSIIIEEDIKEINYKEKENNKKEENLEKNKMIEGSKSEKVQLTNIEIHPEKEQNNEVKKEEIIKEEKIIEENKQGAAGVEENNGTGNDKEKNELNDNVN